jgi:hypothetical protein
LGFVCVESASQYHAFPALGRRVENEDMEEAPAAFVRDAHSFG